MTAQRRAQLLEEFYNTQLQIIDALVDYMVPLYRYFARELDSRNTETEIEEGLEGSAKRCSRLKATQLRQIAKMLMEFRQAFEQSNPELLNVLKNQFRELMAGFDYALISLIGSVEFMEPPQKFILDEKATALAISQIKALMSKADDTRDQLFRGNWRLVAEIARRFQSFYCKLDLDELIQEGNTGLLAAIDKFNPRLNNQLSTLAANWIQAKIRRALDNLSETIRTPVYKRQRRKLVQKAEIEILAKHSEKAKAAKDAPQTMTTAERLFGQSVDDKAIADKTGLDVNEVQELRRLYPETVSIHESVGGDGDSDRQERGDLIADKNNPEEDPSQTKTDRKAFFDLLTGLVDNLPLVYQVVLSGLNGLTIRKKALRKLLHEKVEILQKRGTLMGRGIVITGKARVQIFK